MKEVVRFIGIDFGTSTSVVSFLDYTSENGVLNSQGNLQSVDFDNNRLIPTVIFDNNKRRLFGTNVNESYFENYPQFINREFKMRLSSAESQTEREKANRDTVDFFKYLAERYFQWESAHNHNISERQIYVSYPAKWENNQRGLTIRAAEKAFNLPDGGVRSIDEPTAALRYCINSKQIDDKARDGLCTNIASNILVIDMGAGTTDLVLFRYMPNGSTTVLSKFPEPGCHSITFGGREIDQILKEHFIDKYYGWEEENESLILIRCKKWKEECSDFLNKGIDDGVLPPNKLKIKGKKYIYDRNGISVLLSDYICKFPDLVNGAIRDGMQNDIQFRDEKGVIDYVILTGGHSQWFFIEDMLMGKWLNGLPGNENFGSGIILPRIQKESWRLIKTELPQQIVSFGLCMSGMSIPVIQLSNTDVWLEVEFGLSRTEKINILKKSVRLPQSTQIAKEFECKIFSNDYNIPIKITPIIGRNADDFLDTISIEVPTSFWSDVFNSISNLLYEEKYRDEKIILSLNCSFDENQLLRLSGTISSLGPLGGKAYERSVSMSPSQIAENISKSLKGN